MLMRPIHVYEMILKAWDEVCGKKKGRIIDGDTEWWNQEVKEAIPQKKVAYKKMCENQTEKNKVKYNILAKKVVANSMRKVAERVNQIEPKTNNFLQMGKL